MFFSASVLRSLFPTLLLTTSGFLVPLKQAVAQQGSAQANGSTYADQDNALGPQGPRAPQGIWSVDQATGSLHVKIALDTVPRSGRGPQIPYLFQYNSSSLLSLSRPSAFSAIFGDNSPFSLGAQTLTTFHFTWVVGREAGSTSAGPIGPWTATYGPHMFVTRNSGRAYGYQFGSYTQDIYTDCGSNGPFLYADENGQMHDLNLSTTWSMGGSSAGPSCPTSAAITTQGGTLDGSDIAGVVSGYTEVGGSGTAGLGPGTPGTLQPLLDPEGRQISDGFIEDSNGNYITTVSGNVQDSEGRIIVSAPQELSGGDIGSGTYNIKTQGAAGEDHLYTITTAAQTPSWKFSMPHPTGSEVEVEYAAPWVSLSKTTVVDQSISDTNAGKAVSDVTSIRLPNSTSYTFGYDPDYGTISMIAFPQGGYVRFLWTIRPVGARSYQSPVLILAESTLVVSDAFVSDGVNPESHWHYDYADLDASTGNLVTTETRPDGASVVHTNAPYPFDGIYGGAQGPSQEILQNVTSSSGVLLESISTAYALTPGKVSLPSQVVTTYWDGTTPQQQQVAFSYDKYNNVIEKDDSDVYPCSSANACTSAPPWLRKTFTAYLWNQNPLYEKAHIVNKPSQMTITDNAGNDLAQTSYGYDEFALTGSGGILNHDDTQYPASKQTGRGNLTTVSRCATFSSGSCAQSLSATYRYDIAGQRVSEKDPVGNETKYIYTDQYAVGTPPGATDAYVTQIVYPNGTSEKRSYNFYDGSIASNTDVNGQATTYTYADSLGRLTASNLPDGGSTEKNYNGDPVPAKVTTTVATGEQSGPIVRAVSYDGLGRVVKSEIVSDSSGATTVDTQYDPLGRLATVSNPHRSAASPTDGITIYSYDALGRVTKTLLPDGSSTHTDYQGVTADTYDENGNHTQRTTDALGRLATVIEPDAASGALAGETDYAYDGVDNLIHVDQWGGARGSAGDRQRTFVYDALSRLTSSTNPESGTVGYTYDPNGNVQTKTDARGVAVAYSYDALNRLLGKTYNDGTLPVHYAYDESATSVHPGGDDGFGMTTPTNAIGRLTSEYVGTTSPGVARKVFSYDAMGRKLMGRQCWDTLCSQTSMFRDNWHRYDLAGNVIYQNNSAVQGQTISYDSAGRVVGIATEHDGDPTVLPLVTNVQYDPVGPTQATLGAGQVETWSRDSRLRVSSYQRTNSANPAQVDYAYAPSYQPNGNVYQATEAWQGGGGTWSYNYDALNRLTGVQQPALSEGCAYSYDPFGNRQSESPAGPAGSQCLSFSASFDTNNRIAGWCYDPSGNLLDDGACPPAGSPHKYSYDGEDRLASAEYGQTRYTYDAEGYRVGTTAADGTVTDVVFDDVTHQPVARYVNDDSTGQNQDLWFNGEHLGFMVVDGANNRTISWSATDWLGSERLRTDGAGNRLGLYTSLPFGEALTTLAGTDTDAVHFTGKERDTESGLDNFGPRYYASTMGRFMSPDDVGGHLEDPQTLNLYSYVGNNPLSRTDPSGHDFYQSCDKASSTCGNQNIGTKDNPVNHLVQGTTDSNGKFSAGIVTSASLSDPNSGNSAVVNGTGVQVTSAAGTAQGIFINGTPSADIKGQGAGFDQFSFHIDSNYAQRGVLAAGTATYLGSGGKQGMLDAINGTRVNGHGPFRYSEESTRFGNPFHPGEDNFRFSTGSDPEHANYGPSPHFAVPRGPGDTGDFHVDSKTGPAHLPCALVGIGCY